MYYSLSFRIPGQTGSWWLTTLRLTLSGFSIWILSYRVRLGDIPAVIGGLSAAFKKHFVERGAPLRSRYKIAGHNLVELPQQPFAGHAIDLQLRNSPPTAVSSGLLEAVPDACT